MIVFWGAALVVGVIAACVGPFYYSKRSSQRYDKSVSIENESPLVHIKISHPHRAESSSEIFFDASDNRPNSIDSNGAKKIEQVVNETGPVFSEEAQIVPVKPPRNRRRPSMGIWSSALRNQLENITNSSSEACGGTKVVRAQVEANSRNSASKEFFHPLRRDYRNFSRRASSQSYLTDDKVRKLSSVARKWKSFKKTLIFSGSDRSPMFKDIETDDTQRLSIPVRTLNQRSPLGCSATLQKNRLVDVSTSTRISANGSNLRTRNEEIIAKHDNTMDKNDDASKQSQNNHRSVTNSNAEASQEVVSLTKRESVDGKSICDVRISGLAVNQTQLSDLFEATEGKTRTASIVSTEEASIISIKFHRRRNSNEVSHTKDTFLYECPLTKFYRTLPEILEDLSISRLFRSQEASEKTNRATPIKISDHSRTLNHSRNETSYIPFPKYTNRFVADDSAFGKERGLSRRFSNSHATRFFEERRI